MVFCISHSNSFCRSVCTMKMFIICRLRSARQTHNKSLAYRHQPTLLKRHVLTQLYQHNIAKAKRNNQLWKTQFYELNKLQAFFSNVLNNTNKIQIEQKCFNFQLLFSCRRIPSKSSMKQSALGVFKFEAIVLLHEP